MRVTTNEPVSVTQVHDVAVIRIDNPPVNALENGVPEALEDKVRQAEQDARVRAIVVICAGRTFVAGADIKELDRSAWSETVPPPDFHGVLTKIEDCSKPVVMALHGTALGGGLELAMAGHYRVAAPTTRLGLPEVNLGIIPGAEGTQRLPRLVGPEKALQMVVSGKPITAPDALAAGLVDRLADGELEGSAVAFAREAADRGEPPPRTRDRDDKLGTPASNAAVFAAARELARKTRRNQNAPLAAIEAIEAATTLPFDEGSAREGELSIRCVRSDQGRAMIHVFLAERAVARVPDVKDDTPAGAFDRVAVVGAGTMGIGIATACADAGLSVVLIDTSREAADAGKAAIRKNYDVSIARGRFSREEVEERLGRIRPEAGYRGCADADLVIEAVFENLALKKEVLAEIARVAKPQSVLATNTSTLDIDEIASATKRPGAVIGLHFFNPANVMRLVEIVRGKATSRETIATALALSKSLRKVGVVVGNGPAFVGNRMMFPYMYEAQFLVEDGATPEQVDRALTTWGMAMGIFAVDDLGGLDVAWRVRQELKQFADPVLRKPLASERLYEMGRLGRKTGRGWYLYHDGRTPVPDPEVLEIVDQVAAAAGIRRRSFTDEEIVERTIYALINEGARALEDGVATRSADIDVVYTAGYGFPAYRGGPMFHADQVGLGVIYDRVKAFHGEFGERWKPAPLLARLAAKGMTFREFDAERETMAAERP